MMAEFNLMVDENSDTSCKEIADMCVDIFDEAADRKDKILLKLRLFDKKAKERKISI